MDRMPITMRTTVAIATAALFVVAAGGYILAAGTRSRRLTWLTKPFAMPFLALAYATASVEPDVWILVGLLTGAVGDVALIDADRRNRFALGLAAFLLGHLAYIAAFLRPLTSGAPVAPTLLVAVVPLAMLGFVVYRILRPGLETMKIPVVAYTTVILAMALAALLRGSFATGPAFWLPLAGAVCFLVSDTALAYRIFRGWFRFADRLVAVSYVAAQVLIVAGFLFGV